MSDKLIFLIIGWVLGVVAGLLIVGCTVNILPLDGEINRGGDAGVEYSFGEDVRDD